MVGEYQVGTGVGGWGRGNKIIVTKYQSGPPRYKVSVEEFRGRRIESVNGLKLQVCIEE